VRTVFFGTPELAAICLETVASRHEIAAVVCQPDKPQGRSKKPVPPPTKQFAVTQGIPVHQPVVLNDGTFEALLRDLEPEVCVLVAYGRILKQPILDVPPHGFLNVHPSLLPRYRGPSPIQTAILEGEEMTGVSVMKLDTGVDTGDVLLQERVPIAPDDTTGSLSEKLARVGAKLLQDGLNRIASGNAVFTAQDHTQATVTRRYEKQDGRIRWGSPARTIHNLVRAAVPWPVAHCRFKGEICRIHKTEVVMDAELVLGVPKEPGMVTRIEPDRVIVTAGEGQIAIRVFQAPGKRAMDIADYLRGHAIVAGDRFEDL